MTVKKKLHQSSLNGQWKSAQREELVYKPTGRKKDPVHRDVVPTITLTFVVSRPAFNLDSPKVSGEKISRNDVQEIVNYPVFQSPNAQRNQR